MPPPAVLNYTILGLDNFQVFPHRIWDEEILVDELLENISKGMKNPIEPSELELWLVCNNTSQGWIKIDCLFFSAEVHNPL